MFDVPVAQSLLTLGAGIVACYVALRLGLAALGRWWPRVWLLLDDYVRLTDQRLIWGGSALLALAIFGMGLVPPALNPLTDPAIQAPRTRSVLWTPQAVAGWDLVWPTPAATVAPYLWEESYTATLQIASLPPAAQRQIYQVDLARWPRPTGDNGRGLHWFPTTRQSRDVVDRYVPELVAMHIKWVVILNGLGEWDIYANDYLVTQLRQAGIMPILRIVAPVGPLEPAVVRGIVRHYRLLGVYYYQVFNEPNLHDQWAVPEPHSPARFVDYWLPAAQVIVDERALAGLAPLAPGGDLSDYAFLRGCLADLTARNVWGVLSRTWIGLHNYTFGVPPPEGYVTDDQGFARYRRYNAIVVATLGESRPILSVEAGPAPADGRWNPDPAATPAVQAEWVLAAYAHMRRAPAYFFCHSPWLIGNKVGGGKDERWEPIAWFKEGAAMPVVARLKGE
ncbi:MAG: hypothetical protein KKA73_11400 [Chloroflexi bacterium]|nr:hypothetical protein [Chloroflexota bacterium]